jgi:beta-phosphoglucomutase family hydrolase
MIDAGSDPRRGTQSLGLPSGIRACLFDLDGVLTRTASVHAAAWKTMFDGFLRTRAARTGERFIPFDPGADYAKYVDGRPRQDGVRSYLAARGIELPDGRLDDPVDAETSGGLANRKNELVLALIREQGVEAYEGSIRYVNAVRAAGLRSAVVSASANAREVLEAAGVAHLFDERLDGIDAERMHLQGKPAPDTFLAAARALWVFSAEAAVFEDALAGVAAARAGSFGYVVGVDRLGQAQALHDHGADVVVSDLDELLPG